jgi:hypothetical protein
VKTKRKMEVNMKKDNYKKGTVCEKTIVNKLIKDLTIEHGRNSGKAIILDAPELFTKTALVQAKMKPENIYIPNFTNSFKKIKAKHNNTYPLYLGELLDKNKNELKGKVTISFFDYMNTLEGSNTDPKNCPKKDIEKYFEYGLPADNSILIVTLCYRDQRTKIGVFTELVSFVTTTSYKHKYLVKILPFGKSYKGMFYQVFEIHKIGEQRKQIFEMPKEVRIMSPSKNQIKFQVLQMKKSGMNLKQIKNKTGIPIKTLWEWLY